MKNFRLLSSFGSVFLLLAMVRLAQGQPVPDATWLSRIRGHSDERATDLRVKVIGGFVVAKRTRTKAVWRFNPEFDPLRISQSCTSTSPEGCTVEVARGHDPYTLLAGSNPPHYVRGSNTIRKIPEGWRWEGPIGSWIEYGESGHATSYGSRNGLISTLQCDSAGRLTAFLDRLGNVVLEYERDPEGRVTMARDYAGREVRYSYVGNHLIEVTDPLGKATTDNYSGDLLTSRRSTAGQLWTYSYNESGILTAVRDSDGYGVEYQYDFDDRNRQYYIRQRYSGNRVIETWYDTDDGLVRQDLNGRTVLRVKRERSSRIVTDENGNTTRVSLDSRSRPVAIALPNGATVRRTFSSIYDLTHTVTDENGVTTEFKYDQRGNAIRMIEAVGRAEARVTEFAYDGFGQLIEHREVVEGGADRVNDLPLR